MKTIVVTLLMLFSLSFSAKSQILIYSYCFEPNTNCAGYSMSDPEPILNIENAPNNVWETGQPQKTNFTTGFNSLRAIVTDTLDAYPSNDTSAFVISYTTHEPSNSIHWANFDLSFDYYVDSDTLTDYGTIEFSPDNGTTWINLLNDPTYDSYLSWDISGPNGNIPPTLSGSSNGWIHRSVSLGNLGTYLAIPAGTIIQWRFTFTSDGNQTNRDGLMYDNIYLDITPPLGLEETNVETFQISPNPVYSTIETHFSETQENVSYVVHSSEGRLIKQFPKQKTETTLNLDALNSGVYYLSIYDADGNFLASKKFIKQ